MNKAEVLKIKEYCDKFEHCGDYGKFYLEKKHTVLHVVLGDADGDPDMGYSDIEYFSDNMEDLGVEVKIYAEYDPTEGSPDDYILISYGIEVYYDFENDENILSPSPLDRGEQYLFNEYLKSLSE